VSRVVEQGQETIFQVESDSILVDGMNLDREQPQFVGQSAAAP
jgi:hypothetical protein